MSSQNESLSDLVTRLEAVTARITGGGAKEGEDPLCLQEYDMWVKGEAQAFFDACAAIKSVNKLGDQTKIVVGHVRKVIEASLVCKKDDNYMMTFLDPIVKVITGCDAQIPRDKKTDEFAFFSAFKEFIQYANWVCLNGGVKTYVSDTIKNGADFYMTKILTASKKQDDGQKKAYRAWVKTAKAFLTSLGDYLSNNLPNGIVWKGKGALKEWKSGAKASTESKEEKLDDTERVLACVQNLEEFSLRQRGGGDGPPPRVSEFDAFIEEFVNPFITAAKALKLDKIAKDTEDSFTELKDVVAKTVKYKKPGNDLLMTYVPKILAGLGAYGLPERDDFEQHNKAFGELLNGFGAWIVQPSPPSHCEQQLQAADYALTKVLMDSKKWKDKGKIDADARKAHVAYVNTAKAMMNGLKDYLKNNFKTGLMWNVKGEALPKNK